jgi:hypothetical protein
MLLEVEVVLEELEDGGGGTQPGGNGEVTTSISTSPTAYAGGGAGIGLVLLVLVEVVVEVMVDQMHLVHLEQQTLVEVEVELVKTVSTWYNWCSWRFRYSNN